MGKKYGSSSGAKKKTNVKTSANDTKPKDTQPIKQVKIVKNVEKDDWDELRTGKGFSLYKLILLGAVGIILISGVLYLIFGNHNYNNVPDEKKPVDEEKPPAPPVEPDKPVTPAKKPTKVVVTNKKTFSVPSFPDSIEINENYMVPTTKAYYNKSKMTVEITYRYKANANTEYVNVLGLDTSILGIYEVTYSVAWPDGDVEQIIRTTEVKDTVAPVIVLTTEDDEPFAADGITGKGVNAEITDATTVTTTLNGNTYDGNMIEGIADKVKTYQLIATDSSNNETVVNFTIDKKAPEMVNITYTLDEINSTEDTKYYFVKMMLDEESYVLPGGWSRTETANEITLDESQLIGSNISIIVEDIYGNNRTINFVVTPGTVEIMDISYATNLENTETEITVYVNEPVLPVAGWTLSNNKMELKRTVKDNETGTITVTDYEGNTDTDDYLVNWLLLVEYEPTPEIPEDITETVINEETGLEEEVVVEVERLVTKEVLVTVRSAKSFTITEPLGMEGFWTCEADKMTCTHVYTDNTVDNDNINGETWEYVFDDALLTNLTFNVVIEGITFDTDPDNELILIDYDVTELTNGNVKVTVTLPTCHAISDGWEMLSIEEDTDHCQYIKIYEENTKETIDFLDNFDPLDTTIYRVQINIENIDKTPPEAEVLITTDPEGVDPAEVRLNFDEEVQDIEGWTMDADNQGATKEFAPDAEDTSVVVLDLAENETTVEIEFDWNEEPTI